MTLSTTPRTSPSTRDRCDGGIGYPCDGDPVATLSRVFWTGTAAAGREVTSDPHPICASCLDDIVRDDVPSLPNDDTRTVGFTIRGLGS